MTAALLIQVALKSSVVLAATWAVARAMRRRSAAARHLVWTLGVVATLLLPVVSVVGPTWNVSLQPFETFESFGTFGSFDRSNRSVGDGGSAVEALPVPPAGGERIAVEAPLAPEIDWMSLLIAAWLGGALIAMVHLAAGVFGVRRMVSRAPVLDDAAWRTALDEAVAALSLPARVSLRMTSRTSVPLVCGWWNAIVLLPDGAAHWSADRCRVVLLHELAHVRRRDCAVLALATLMRALHWFNPLAYVAVRQLRAEQERAADDMVLASGTRASAYADHLFEIVRAFRAPVPFTGSVLTMARPSEMEGRLTAILDEYRDRGPLSRGVRMSVGVATGVALVAIAALKLSAAGPPQALTARTTVAEIAPSRLPAPEPAVAPRVSTAAPSRSASQGIPAPPATLDVSPSPDPAYGLPPQAGAPPRPGNAVPKPVPTQADAATRKRVADALVIALDDSNQRVREQALDTLASMRDERAIPGLIKALGDVNADVRRRAIGGLQQFNTPEATAAIVKAMNDASPEVRERAAIALGNLGNAAAVEPLARALKDSNANVRRRAAWALGTLADPAAIDPLTAALKDADPDVRQQAAQSLGWIARGRRGFSFKDIQFDVSAIGESAMREAEKAIEVQREQLRDFQNQWNGLPAPPEPPLLPSPPR